MPDNCIEKVLIYCKEGDLRQVFVTSLQFESSARIVYMRQLFPWQCLSLGEIHTHCVVLFESTSLNQFWTFFSMKYVSPPEVDSVPTGAEPPNIGFPLYDNPNSQSFDSIKCMDCQPFFQMPVGILYLQEKKSLAERTFVYSAQSETWSLRFRKTSDDRLLTLVRSAVCVGRLTVQLCIMSTCWESEFYERLS